MDLIDIILARAKSFTGETATLTRQAQAAMADANNIVDRLEAIEADAQAASSAAEAAAETFENMITFTDSSTSAAKILETTLTKGTDVSTYTVEKNYTSYGDNEDGSMTQKAIKQYVTSVQSDLEEQIAAGLNSADLGINNSGYIVIINEEGKIVSGDVTESSIIDALIKSGSYVARNAVGVEIDYNNKTSAHVQEAAGKTPGADFNSYPMFGGRMRCNVADNGTINAFYGDSGYKDDGSNGQVMVYQPKFYYRRVPIATSVATLGSIIRKEILIISATKQAGFKVHPIFLTSDGEELDYVLLSAYESCVQKASDDSYITNDSSDVNFSTDKLSSIAGVKPVSGCNKQLNTAALEHLATNRGTGWHITNLAAESANQMLELVEFGTANFQNALEKGIVNLSNTTSGINGASQTGSTASLGNVSGHADGTVNITNGSTNTYYENGKRAISYRGQENLWGNQQCFIGGLYISGNGEQGGGLTYICKSWNYSDTSSSNYDNVGFYFPSNSNWIAGFGLGNRDYDWVFLPAEANNNANSYAPVGDYVWTTNELNGTHGLLMGGSYSRGDYAGHFNYGADNDLSAYGRATSARLMFIPTKNTIYTNNYNAWSAKMGG